MKMTMLERQALIDQQARARIAAEDEAIANRRLYADKEGAVCCGAPSVPYPSRAFSQRHWKVKSRPCRKAKDCRNLYDRTKYEEKQAC